MPFFTEKPLNSTKKGVQNWFFIPIVEQIKEENFAAKKSWKLAESSNIRRQFYTSTDSLFQSESGRIPANKHLSCYKVILNDCDLAQRATEPLKGEKIGFAAFLSISPEEIRSLIVFKAEGLIEYPNPFYEELTNTATASCC